MTHQPRRTPGLPLGTVAVLLLAAACRDTTAPTTGALRVTLSTTGGDLDLDGYTLTLDADPPMSVVLNATVLFRGLAVGPHEVALSGVAANCTLGGTNPLPVTIRGGDTTHVSFAIACVATGVQVTAATTGVDLDPSGYRVRVDGGPELAIGVNGTVAVTRLTAGDHTVAVGDVAANCTVGGENPRSVTIAAGETLPVAFSVSCVATTGAVEITAATSGIDFPSGYTVRVDNGSPVTVPANGKVTFSALIPGNHTIVLDGVTPNCTLAGENPRTVAVTAGGVKRDTTRTTFEASCVALWGVVEVTAVTTGAPIDPDGYTVRLDGSGLDLGSNGKVTFSNVTAGDHSVLIFNVASNCNVGGANPRTVTVTTGGATRDTVRTAFEVTCYSTTGAIEVTTATSGADLDPNGYTLTVDGYLQLFVATNGFVRIDPVSIGSHTVALSGVARNCTVTGGDVATVTVASGATTQLTFMVTCAALGRVQVTAATTGVDLDPDGYSAVIDGTAGSVPTNGSAIISGVLPGDYAVTLHGVAANCDVTSPNPRTITVSSGSTVPAAFDVACAQATQLAVAASVSGNTDIYVVKANGTGLSRLTTDPAHDDTPAWSPPSIGKIAFQSARGGNSDIYVMNADGSGVARLTSAAGPDYRPRWSPDGGRITFVSQRDGNAEIYTMNADGTSQIRLTNHPATDADPAWSPDGSKIAFWSSRDGNPEIYVMNADGSGLTRLTTNGVEDLQPEWSPDGTKLVFSRLTSCDYGFCDYDLYVMNADGSGAVRLTAGSSDNDPVWSPDGRWIAFGATFCQSYSGYYYYYCYSTSSAVHLVRADGTRLVELLGNATHPAWRP